MILKASQMIAQAVNTGQSRPDILIVGRQAAAGDSGASKPPAQDGRNGRNADCGWRGCDSSTRGTKGDDGKDGDHAQNGTDGGDAPPAKIFVGTLQGTMFVFGRGGDGGNGGKGGNGAMAEMGATAATSRLLELSTYLSTCLCLRANPVVRAAADKAV